MPKTTDDTTGTVTPTLALVIESVGFIEKDKTNTHDGYAYQSEAAVKAAVQRALIRHGIAPEGVSYDVLSDVQVAAKSGGMRNMIKLRCVLTLFGSRYEGLGCGVDYGDKALMKAQTSAYREAWKGALCIPSGGGDPEEHDAAIDQFDGTTPAPAQAPARRQAAPPADDWGEPPGAEAQAPRGGGGGGARLPNMKWLGNHAGALVIDAPLGLLERYLQWRMEKPAEQKWAAKERELTSAIAAEIAERGKAGPAGEGDEIPF